MIERRPRRTNEKGQSAVEVLFGIPVLLTIFVLGFQLFEITWNAQYAHVRSRQEMMNFAAHRPCFANNDGGTNSLGNGTISPSQARIDATLNPGAPGSPGLVRRRQIRHRASVYCNQP